MAKCIISPKGWHDSPNYQPFSHQIHELNLRQSLLLQFSPSLHQCQGSPIQHPTTGTQCPYAIFWVFGIPIPRKHPDFRLSCSLILEEQFLKNLNNLSTQGPIPLLFYKKLTGSNISYCNVHRNFGILTLAFWKYALA